MHNKMKNRSGTPPKYKEWNVKTIFKVIYGSSYRENPITEIPIAEYLSLFLHFMTNIFILTGFSFWAEYL